MRETTLRAEEQSGFYEVSVITVRRCAWRGRLAREDGERRVPRFSGTAPNSVRLLLRLFQAAVAVLTPSMNTPLLHLLRAASVSAAFVPLAQAQIISNGTGGGDFATGSTWNGGIAPLGASAPTFRILSGDTVTANTGVNYNRVNNNVEIFGTLNVTSGASVVTGRLNNGTAGAPLHVENSTINVTGGTLSISRISPSTFAGTNTINVSGGEFIFRDGVAQNLAMSPAYIYNISNTGVFRTAGSFNSATNLNGGTIIFESMGKFIGGTFTWTGGTVFLSSGSAYSGADGNRIFNAWNSNASNVLAFSSQSTKQTLTFGTTSYPAVNGTQGTLSFNIYSSAANDNDLLNFIGTSSISLGSGVGLRLNGVSLGGVANDYLGQSYKLFDITTGVYSNLTPTIAATTWNIGGTDYEIGWTNHLATNGTLTIASITAIPEPSAFAALGGLAALAFASSRRRSRR